MTKQSAFELDALVAMAQRARAVGAKDVDHMDGAAAAFNYVRIADVVRSVLTSESVHSPILDWGCGYGQVSWLLRRRGLSVISCDVEKRRAQESMPELASLSVERIEHPVLLPYDSGAFAAVLSVGVLEHVPDLDGSLEELNRIMRPRGLLFIFMFPNRLSWAEWLADLRHISVHPQKYTFRQTGRILSEHGFAIERKWRRNFLPRNLTGSSLRIKRLYGRCYRQIESLDTVLANLPPTSFFSGVLELIVRKRR
jgi:SAM-dependent methyltransferase